MGKRAELFEASLQAAGYDVLGVELRKGEGKARSHDLPRSVREDLVRLYRELGGVRADQDFATGRWDVVCRSGLIFEFDEDLHFNEYRAATLQPVWTGALPWKSAYVEFSDRHRDMCLKAGGYGGKWANPSTDSMFGGSDGVRNFNGLGSSRWKQRALYDSVKDAYALHTPGASLVRISIHDVVDGAGVNATLNSGRLLNADALRAFIEKRTVSAQMLPRGFVTTVDPN